jgi:hypothetical protein
MRAVAGYTVIAARGAPVAASDAFPEVTFGGHVPGFPDTYGYTSRHQLCGAMRWVTPRLERSTLALALAKRGLGGDGLCRRRPSTTG